VREEWSTEEEVHRCPGHCWISKFGTFSGTMICVEKKLEFQVRKWEEYRVTRYSDGDSVLVVELSGLTFQEWDPSAGSDDTSAPVAMIVNSIELRATDFHLTEAVVRAARQ
jgi:hypothetical protein